MNSKKTGWMVLFLAVLAEIPVQAQIYQSYKSTTSFFSNAPIEDIEAVNNAGASILNAGNGEIVFLIPIRGFQFRKSLMQEHFNEKYLESDKYPTATFKGKILNFKELKEGKQAAQAEGTLTIHGAEKPVKVSGTIERKGEEIHLVSSFKVTVKDHNIKIPRLVIRNIAEVVEVSVEYYYKPRQ